MSSNLVELTEKRKRWVEANRENGFEDGIKRLLTELYPDNAHFIYELLQNAEDTEATIVRFNLYNDRLEYTHNGSRLFSYKDVDSITSIGVSSKRDDPTMIGKFGVGFKAVFAYTNTPEIHSDKFHFRIHDLVVPETVAAHSVDEESQKTRFVFPFEHPKKSPDVAAQEISQALKELDDNTLLFLHNIRKIEYLLPNEECGSLERKVQGEGRIVIRGSLPDGNEHVSNWIRFEDDVHVIDREETDENRKIKLCRIAIAYCLKNVAKEDMEPDWKVAPLDRGQVSIFFPAEKESSNLHFHIHAPFASTVARDSIRDCEANNTLLCGIAKLTAETLTTLCEKQLMNVTSYNALPIQVKDFSDESLYRPIYEKVREAFKTKALLPAHKGGFVCASDSKLARGKELVDLFSSEQLSQLFGKDRLTWLEPAITESGSNADFHTFLTGKKKWLSKTEWDMAPLCEGIEVTPESLALKLTCEFLAEQDDDWLLCFIPFAMEGAKALKTTPFVRLDDGKHVALPPDNAADRPAWFAPKNTDGVNLKGFPLVHSELAGDNAIRKLLEKEGLREIDAAAIVERSILPLYDGKRAFDEQEYRNHLRQIAKALRKVNESAKKQLTSKLEQFQWLACVHASGSRSDVDWKNQGSSDIYCNAIEIETWFRGLHDVEAFFPLQLVEQELGSEFRNVVKPHFELTRMLPLTEKDEKLSPKLGAPHRRGLNGFNPDAKIIGLQEALNDWSMERALILWNIMLEAPRIISGETQSETNRQRLDAAPKKYELSEVGKLCRNYSCLPDKHGGWHKPSELFLVDLPDAFATTSIRAKEVADKLGMKKPEVEEATEKLSRGDPRKKKLLEQIANASEEELGRFEKLVPTSLPPQPFPSFKDGLNNMHRSQRGNHSSPTDHPQEIAPVSNPGLYQDKLDERVDASFQEHVSNPRTISFSPVRDRPDNKEAREFLYQEYQGRCQMTGATFPKASADADGNALNYFEVCSMLPYSNAEYLNDAGNMLCLSADSTAKLRHASFEWIDDVEEKITEFESGGSIAQEVSVNIRVAGEECSITWKQRHFMRLVTLYRNSTDRKKTDELEII